MKKNISLAICALAISASAAVADVKIQANSGQALTTSTQSLPFAAGGLAATPGLVVLGAVVAVAAVAKIVDNNRSGSH
jgi:putative ribosome biogenesis GTPase RsgA